MFESRYFLWVQKQNTNEENAVQRILPTEKIF